MTGFNHGMTGAVIALAVKRPELAVPLAFLSHFAQDAIPHFDYFQGKTGEGILKGKFNVLLSVDFFSSILLMVILGIAFPDHRWLIWSCMIAAASPDLIWGYHFLVRGKKVRDYGPVLKLIDKTESEYRGWPGAAGEILWFVVAGFVLVKLR
jgi:hypothetical protein